MGGVNNQTNLIKEYCLRFPTVQHLTLAKKIYSENKESFKNVEHCRDLIRNRRGKISGSGYKVKEVAEYTPELPKSYAETFEPFILSQSKVLIISDLHFPYQDNKAIELALNYGQKKGMNCILINGDLFDFATISRHEKDWRHRPLKEEIETVNKFFAYLKKRFPKVRIIFKEGNHDERFDKWLFHKSPEVYDVAGLTLKDVLKLPEKKIELVTDRLPVKIGKLTVLHGHELNGSGGVNPARATFLKTIDNVLIGHCHRTSQHTEPTLGGDVIITTSTGCLCGMYPMYARVNKWNQGFAFVDHEIKTGEYRIENLKIINGKVY